MKFRIDKTLKVIIPVLIALAALIVWLVPWQCSQAQTVAYNPTPQEQTALVAKYGDDYLTIVHDRLREHIRNLVSEGNEQIRQHRAQLLESPEMKVEEKQVIETTLGAVKSREAAKLKSLQDSLKLAEPPPAKGG